jgi:hypothetical protein
LAQSFIDSLLAEIDYRYNFRLDLSKFYRLFQDDPQLGPVITKSPAWMPRPLGLGRKRRISVFLASALFLWYSIINRT